MKITESRFDFNIDNYDTLDNDYKMLSKSKVSMISQKDAIVNSFFVDLGLKSKTLWARYNLGVDSFNLNETIDWCGNFYAWGEVDDYNKFIYKWETYKFMRRGNLIKYNITDDLYILDLEDDAAYVNNPYKEIFDQCMPDSKHIDELIKYTNQEFVRNYKGYSGLNGIIFKSDRSEDELFIPIFGRKDRTKTIINDWTGMAIWTSSLDSSSPNQAVSMFSIANKKVIKASFFRYQGLNIRPILLNIK